MRTCLLIPTTSGGLSLNTREFCTSEETTMKIFLMNFWKRLCFMFNRPAAFMLYGKLGVDFLSFSELIYPSIRIRLQLIRARPNFYEISDNPNLNLGIVGCSLYTRRIAVKDDYHKKRMNMLALTIWKLMQWV